MIIYEVNLNIDDDIYPEFKVWLNEHVKEMLQFPGFIQASFLKQEKDKDSCQEKLTIQYQLNDKEALDRYFSEFAPMMREKGLALFKNKFFAERRIFELLDVIQK